MIRFFYLLVNFFSDFFIVLPKQSSIDLSEDMTFFSKNQALGASIAPKKDVIQSACGVLCLQMVLSFYHKIVPSLESLSLALMHAQAFSVEQGLVLTRVNKVLRKYGFSSKAHGYISYRRLFYYLVNGTPVIASVAGVQGGHLIVLAGVSIENGQVKRILYLDPNNSAVHSLVTVTFEEWQILFNRRALVVYPMPVTFWHNMVR